MTKTEAQLMAGFLDRRKRIAGARQGVAGAASDQAAIAPSSADIKSRLPMSIAI